MSFSTKAPCVTFTIPLQNATGRMPYTLTNDYMFRAMLQRSKGALKGIVCSITGFNPKLGYLCRSFDSLNRGQDYMETKPVIQVCFLNFTLFPEAPEFFSTYMFMNVKNNMIYSDKLKLSVVDLTHIDMATEEDKLRGIDHWARLFKATTWEEIKMLSSKDSFLAEAAETTYQLSSEETIRMQCEAREDYYKQQRYIQKKQERLEQELAKLQRISAQKDEEITRLKEQLSKLQDK